jgi:hypothetical protein
MKYRTRIKHCFLPFGSYRQVCKEKKGKKRDKRREKRDRRTKERREKTKRTAERHQHGRTPKKEKKGRQTAAREKHFFHSFSLPKFFFFRVLVDAENIMFT